MELRLLLRVWGETRQAVRMLLEIGRRLASEGQPLDFVLQPNCLV